MTAALIQMFDELWCMNNDVASTARNYVCTQSNAKWWSISETDFLLPPVWLMRKMRLVQVQKIWEGRTAERWKKHFIFINVLLSLMRPKYFVQEEVLSTRIELNYWNPKASMVSMLKDVLYFLIHHFRS